MRNRQFLLIGIMLILVMAVVTAVAALSPETPEDVPDVVVAEATDYTIQSPKLFYLNNPPCAPIRSPEAEAPDTSFAPPQPSRGNEEAAEPGSVIGLSEQLVGRTAVHGAEPREMYNFYYDIFCEPPDEPDIISNLAADEDYVYWHSREQSALVRVSENRLDWETTPPEIVRSHADKRSELVIVGNDIYMLHMGHDASGLYRIPKNGSSSTQILTSAQTGFPNADFQTDGEYLMWRTWTGSQWQLKRYNLTTGAINTVTSGVISFYSVAGNVAYIGYEDEIRSYNHSTGVLSAPLYTSPVNAYINSITADGSGLYFIRQNASTPGANVLYRLPFGSSTPDPLYAPPNTPVLSMYNLQRDGNYLFFIHGDEIKRIRTNADLDPLTNLRIDGLEITQAIQNDSNSVDLVRGKRTAVRLFASSEGDSVPGVSARLYRINGSGTIIDGPLMPINLARDGAYMRVQTSPDKDNINESFTFFLPPSWVDDPTLRLQAELNPYHAPPESSYADNVLTTGTFDMDASGRLEAHFILFEYDSGGSRIAPRYNEDYLQTVSWVRRTYPVASAPGGYTDSSPGFRPKISRLFDADLGGNVDGTNRHPECQDRIDRDPAEEGYLDDPSLCAAWYVVCPTLDAIRAAEEIPSEIQLVGMVPDGGGFARGWACGGGVSTPTGDTAGRDWGWDFDGSYGDWYAGHEIGHSQGRAHPSSGNECGHSASDGSYPWPNVEIGDESYRGFDMGDTGLNSLLIPRVYPNEWHDMMGYCMAPGQWISDYTYLGIKSFIGSAAGSGSALHMGGTPVLQLSGVIYPDANEADLSQVRLWTSLSSPPAAPVSGPYRIRLLNSGGTQLAAYNFTPEEGEGEIALVMGEFVPFVAGTVRVEITHPASGDVLWSYDISDNAPTVSNVQLVGAPSPVTGEVTLQWTAVDADGDSMTYDVLYSTDDGATWKMVQLGLTSTNTEIDTAVLGGSSQARFKVIANDGLNQGEGMSNAFIMQDKAPVVTVLSPHDGAEYVYGQEVYFSAEVLDYQDGSLAGGDIVWRDQTNFIVGVGTEFSQDNLLIGENIITVTATNSDGLFTEVTFSIFVNDDLELPEATLTVGPDQAGWHVADGETTLQSATISVSNSGDDTFTVTATENASWLTVSQSGNSTPLQLTLSADPSAIESGQTLQTTLQIVGTSSAGTQVVNVPVSLSMGEITAGDGSFRIFLPVLIKP